MHAAPTHISSIASTFTLPDLSKDWPFTSDPNNTDQFIIDESARWVESYEFLSQAAQRKFNACNIGLLAALVYPTARGPRFRAGCDFMNLVFVIEAFTDGKGADEVRLSVTEVMNALR